MEYVKYGQNWNWEKWEKLERENIYATKVEKFYWNANGPLDPLDTHKKEEEFEMHVRKVNMAGA